MKYKKKPRAWQIIFAICCLVYVGWVIHVGTNEFARINGQYHRLTAALDAGRIRSASLEELAAACRKNSRQRPGLEEDACLSWPPQVVAAKEKEITERRTRARGRGTVKLVLFYAGFVSIFLLAPPVLIYLLLAGIITLYKSIKIVR